MCAGTPVHFEQTNSHVELKQGNEWPDPGSGRGGALAGATDVVGWCKLKPLQARVETPGFQRLLLKCDELISSFAFNFNLRLYSQEHAPHVWEVR